MEVITTMVERYVDEKRLGEDIVADFFTYSRLCFKNFVQDTYYHIGKAMGEGMVKLLRRSEKHTKLRGSIPLRQKYR